MIELLTVAQRLQVLASVPEPRLAEGRCRFLAEAARLAGERERANGLSIRWTAFRPRLALASVVLVLLAASLFTLLTNMGLAVGPGSTPLPRLATPALSPTYSATPTQMARLTASPVYPAQVIAAAETLRLPAASPAPEPVLTTVPSRDVYSQLVLIQCSSL